MASILEERTYGILTDPDELERRLVPILRANGSEIPQKGSYVAAVEIDGYGEIIAYQMLQNALFFEGMWSRDGSAHWARIWHGLRDYAKVQLGATSIMTLTKQDELGQKIGRAAERMGLENMHWNVYRGKI